MIRPLKMKQIKMMVLKKDFNAVIEFIGRREVIHFDTTNNEGESYNNKESDGVIRIKNLQDKIYFCAEYLGITIPSEPDREYTSPSDSDEELVEKYYSAVNLLKIKEAEIKQEKKRIEETYSETRAFSNLNISFSQMNQLSFITLKVGYLDSNVRSEFKKQMGERAILIPLGEGEDNRVIAASTRKGRFALDSELKKYSFQEIILPEDFHGIPDELLDGIQKQIDVLETKLNDISVEKERMKNKIQKSLEKLGLIMLIGAAIENIRSQFTSTSSVYFLTGWVPSNLISDLTEELSALTEGRATIRVYNPNEIPEIKNNPDKIPVSLQHGHFVKGFEGVVFSYGTPLYGTIDPTPLVAIFFTLLFGIMFGDLGQGFVLLLLGFFTGKHGIQSLNKKFGKFSSPLIAVGIASMIMGFFYGEFFTNEFLLVTPTRALTSALTGNPVDRIIIIMPLAESGGSIVKLFYFFEFTISIGIILLSFGMVINIVNHCIMKKFETAFFSKSGLSGLLFFWYAIFIAVRFLMGGSFVWPDFIGIFLPMVLIFFGPVIWRCFSRERPILKHGLVSFIVEGFVEIIETLSSYISNSISFLRVGAFALSHAVLSYIVFRFTEEITLSSAGFAGSILSILILIFGNLVIIVLEGLIVTIQVMRLQYYEFFSKFFISTGVRYSPFRFGK